MKQVFLASAGVALLGLGLSARAPQSTPPPRAAAPRITTAAPAAPAPRIARTSTATPAVPAMVAAEQTRLVTTYCATCHSERGKAGGLSLAGWDAMKAQENPAIVEKMIRKLRAGMMPPAGSRRPDAATIENLTSSLEARMVRMAIRFADDDDALDAARRRIAQAMEIQKRVENITGRKIEIIVSKKLP